MSTRISESGTVRGLLNDILRNKEMVNKFADEVASGIKVDQPGESPFAGTIAQYQDSVRKIEGYLSRVDDIESSLQYQEQLIFQVQEILTKAKEMAAQTASENYAPEQRASVASAVFQLRDQLVSIANTQREGRYIYGGTDDDDAPYDLLTYANPATGPESQRWVFDAEAGTANTRDVNITDNLAVRVNTPANTIFDGSIQALERLGRSLAGYVTNPAAGAPDGTGAAYTFPADYALQSQDLRNVIDLIDAARQNDISPEQADLAGRQRRLDAARSILETAKQNGEEVLGRMQQADITESASMLSQAQTALQASYLVNSRVLNLSILDFL